MITCDCCDEEFDEDEITWEGGSPYCYICAADLEREFYYHYDSDNLGE